MTSFWAVLVRDLPRVLSFFALGALMIFGSTWFAGLVNEPAFAPWGLFIGGAFLVAGLVHIIRRLVFPKLDLQLIAITALNTPTGAGLVFLGMCLVIAAFVTMLGAMLRT